MVFHWLFDFYDESAENEQRGKKTASSKKKIHVMFIVHGQILLPNENTIYEKIL